VPYPNKLAPPVRRLATIQRQRLIDLLSEDASRRVTVVTAPAGYGKTTLLESFVQAGSAPVCWYALDERDRDIPTFLRYWLACARTQFADFGRDLEAALEGREVVRPERWVDLMVSAVQEVDQLLREGGSGRIKR